MFRFIIIIYLFANSNFMLCLRRALFISGFNNFEKDNDIAADITVADSKYTGHAYLRNVYVIINSKEHTPNPIYIANNEPDMQAKPTVIIVVISLSVIDDNTGSISRVASV